MSLFDIIVRGGIMMIPIGVLSVIAVSIIIDRIQYLNWIDRNRIDLSEIRSRDDLVRLISRNPPFVSVLKAAYDHQDSRKEDLKEVITIAIREELTKIERRIPTLATVAGVAPLFGFLGTVTGMIRAFMTIQRLAGNVDASVLAGGIWEALVTTAFGLGVGIFAHIFYNHMVGRIGRVTADMERTGFELIQRIGGP
ncbi:MAG TPA: MotA/TolQ/ExbB proton channel family protein [bacterium (Candidatus Stahlbacteria)]|nr:MotA/TolQ/ExbB proton channel family protein [Candidatus Stahlbacteria bacterium]